jgi:hypothetical protein
LWDEVRRSIARPRSERIEQANRELQQLARVPR